MQGQCVAAKLSISLVFALACLAVVPAFAADPRVEREAQALQKKAIEEDNLNVNYAGAIKKLQTAIAECGADRCGPTVRGSLLRDLGAMQILNGNSGEARASFAQALAIDGALELDPAYKTPQLEQVWNDVKKKMPVSSAAPPAAEGELTHSAPADALVRTPFPVFVEYSGGEPLARVVAKYKAGSTGEWKSLDLPRVGNGWGALIPCRDVTPGTLQYYVQGFNAANDPVTASGSRNKPFSVLVKAQLAGPPPALPGQEPPKQCEESVGTECPPEFPGCNDKRGSGEDCGRDGQCKSNACVGGKCADKKFAGASCENEDECVSGQCIEGKCAASRKAEGEDCTGDDECASGSCKEDKCVGGSLKFQRWWVGITTSLDFYVVPDVADVCKLDPATNGTTPLTAGNPYACVNPSTGSNFPGSDKSVNDAIAPSNPGGRGPDQVLGGFTHGNLRILLSIDYAFNPNLLIGLRGGGVLFTDPSNVSPGAAFPPLHLEARATYLIGNNAILKSFAPMAFIAGGLGEFDAFVPVPVSFRDTQAASASATAVKVCSSMTSPNCTENAWIIAGPGFGAVGGGARFLFGKRIAGTAAIKLEGAFGGTAGFLFGVAPEIGVQVGF